MTTHPARTRRAYFLAEMLVCMGLISVVLLLCTGASIRTLRLRRLQGGYYRRMNAADHLLRRVSTDVRNATVFLSEAGEHRAGDATLILRTRTGTVVYTVTETGVQRRETSGDESHTAVSMDAKGVNVVFELDNARPTDARSVATTVSWTEPPGLGVSKPVLSQLVALRW